MGLYLPLNTQIHSLVAEPASTQGADLQKIALVIDPSFCIPLKLGLDSSESLLEQDSIGDSGAAHSGKGSERGCMLLEPVSDWTCHFIRRASA